MIKIGNFNSQLLTLALIAVRSLFNACLSCDKKALGTVEPEGSNFVVLDT